MSDPIQELRPLPEMPFYLQFDPAVQTWLYSFSLWMQDFIDSFNAMAVSSNNKVPEVLVETTGDTPTALYIPFNAKVNESKQWEQIDAAVPSFLITVVASKIQIDFALPGAGIPVVWTTNEIFYANGISSAKAFQVWGTNPLPAAGATYDGVMMKLLGPPDILYICLKDAFGVYNWKLIVSG